MRKRIDERRNAILNMVNECGTLDLLQLRNAFPGVSDVTLRKDLQFLDSTKQAIRTHGGIKSIPSALNYIYRATVNQEQKKMIAAKAAGANVIVAGSGIFKAEDRAAAIETLRRA